MSLTQLYFSFDGRIGRRTFWVNGVLLYGVALLASFFLLGFVGLFLPLLGGLLVLIWYALAIWSSFAVNVKRLHDRDKSGWWVLVGLVPLVGGIWLLVEMGFLTGTDGPNQYGEYTF